MKHPAELVKEEESMAILVELTSAFEGIASMKIAQIKDSVLESSKFFEEIWQIYRQLRVDNLFNFGRSEKKDNADIDKELFIIINAEGGFSGDIDLKLLNLLLEQYNKDNNDIIVIGHHGAIQLAQRGIEYKKYFKLPTKDKNINVMPIIRQAQLYKSTQIFYQEYESLMSQEVKNIPLITAVQERGQEDANNDETISEDNYIFEPDTYAVVAHLENTMMQIAISQCILNSKLAQYASRFKAMSASHQRADEEKANVHLDFNRAKRGIKDERLKEIISGIKMIKGGAIA
jgi:F-type H+-transporting ATPase subunit gamma